MIKQPSLVSETWLALVWNLHSHPEQRAGERGLCVHLGGQDMLSIEITQVAELGLELEASIPEPRCSCSVGDRPHHSCSS